MRTSSREGGHADTHCMPAAEFTFWYRFNHGPFLLKLAFSILGTMAGVLWVAARSRDLLAGGAASFALWRFNRPERPKAQLFHPEFFNLNGGAGEDSEGGGGGDVRVAKPQTAVVIGAGTVGVSLAYQLARRGYNVAVIDAASEVSAECSAAAAGGMARSNAIVSRGTWADVSSAISK
jgi:xanthine/CO dehydrogenase XdhC/CoxF family maturation factor